MIAILFALVLGLGLTWLLNQATRWFAVDGDPIVEQLDAVLPQTQCGQCNYPGCRPYAEAIAKGEAGINQCPPGGEAGIQALADIMGVEPEPLNPENGTETPAVVALIIEEDCIGCTKCIQACPVDAIMGAAKHMHTVIEPACTGCELCIAPCPVDCIELIPVSKRVALWPS